MTVYLIHARTEPHVWIKLEVIAVIARLGTLEATVKRVISNFVFLYCFTESVLNTHLSVPC